MGEREPEVHRVKANDRPGELSQLCVQWALQQTGCFQRLIHAADPNDLDALDRLGGPKWGNDSCETKSVGFRKTTIGLSNLANLSAETNLSEDGKVGWQRTVDNRRRNCQA